MNGANAIGLCECGCGEVAPIAAQSSKRHGWVKGQPMRFVRGHNNRGKAVRKEPYWTVQDRGYETPCWIWVASLRDDGYATIKRYGKNHIAHRFLYEQRHGPVPDGLDLDHLCRNRACVNLDHLEPVTRAENIRRGVACKLTRAAYQEILAQPSSSAAGDLAEEMGLFRKYGQQLWRRSVIPRYAESC